MGNYVLVHNGRKKEINAPDIGTAEQIAEMLTGQDKYKLRIDRIVYPADLLNVTTRRRTHVNEFIE